MPNPWGTDSVDPRDGVTRSLTLEIQKAHKLPLGVLQFGFPQEFGASAVCKAVVRVGEPKKETVKVTVPIPVDRANNHLWAEFFSYEHVRGSRQHPVLQRQAVGIEKHSYIYTSEDEDFTLQLYHVCAGKNNDQPQFKIKVKVVAPLGGSSEEKGRQVMEADFSESRPEIVYGTVEVGRVQVYMDGMQAYMKKAKFTKVGLPPWTIIGEGYRVGVLPFWAFLYEYSKINTVRLRAQNTETLKRMVALCRMKAPFPATPGEMKTADWCELLADTMALLPLCTTYLHDSRRTFKNKKQRKYALLPSGERGSLVSEDQWVHSLSAPFLSMHAYDCEDGAATAFYVFQLLKHLSFSKEDGWLRGLQSVAQRYVCFMAIGTLRLPRGNYTYHAYPFLVDAYSVDQRLVRDLGVETKFSVVTDVTLPTLPVEITESTTACCTYDKGCTLEAYRHAHMKDPLVHCKVPGSLMHRTKQYHHIVLLEAPQLFDAYGVTELALELESKKKQDTFTVGVPGDLVFAEFQTSPNFRVVQPYKPTREILDAVEVALVQLPRTPGLPSPGSGTLPDLEPGPNRVVMFSNSRYTDEVVPRVRTTVERRKQHVVIHEKVHVAGDVYVNFMVVTPPDQPAAAAAAKFDSGILGLCHSQRTTGSKCRALPPETESRDYAMWPHPSPWKLRSLPLEMARSMPPVRKGFPSASLVTAQDVVRGDKRATKLVRLALERGVPVFVTDLERQHVSKLNTFFSGLHKEGSSMVVAFPGESFDSKGLVTPIKFASVCVVGACFIPPELKRLACGMHPNTQTTYYIFFRDCCRSATIDVACPKLKLKCKIPNISVHIFSISQDPRVVAKADKLAKDLKKAGVQKLVLHKATVRKRVSTGVRYGPEDMEVIGHPLHPTEALPPPQVERGEYVVPSEPLGYGVVEFRDPDPDTDVEEAAQPFRTSQFDTLVNMETIEYEDVPVVPENPELHQRLRRPPEYRDYTVVVREGPSVFPASSLQIRTRTSREKWEIMGFLGDFRSDMNIPGGMGITRPLVDDIRYRYTTLPESLKSGTPIGDYLAKQDELNLSFRNIERLYRDLTRSDIQTLEWDQKEALRGLRAQASPAIVDKYRPFFDLYDRQTMPVSFSVFENASREAKTMRRQREWGFSFSSDPIHSFRLTVGDRTYSVETAGDPRSRPRIRYIEFLAAFAYHASPIKKPAFVQNLAAKWVLSITESTRSLPEKKWKDEGYHRNYYDVLAAIGVENTSFIRDMARDIKFPLQELKDLLVFEKSYILRCATMTTEPEPAFQQQLIQANATRRRIQAQIRAIQTIDQVGYTNMAENVLLNDLPRPWDQVNSPVATIVSLLWYYRISDKDFGSTKVFEVEDDSDDEDVRPALMVRPMDEAEARFSSKTVSTGVRYGPEDMEVIGHPLHPTEALPPPLVQRGEYVVPSEPLGYGGVEFLNPNPDIDVERAGRPFRTSQFDTLVDTEPSVVPRPTDLALDQHFKNFRFTLQLAIAYDPTGPSPVHSYWSIGSLRNLLVGIEKETEVSRFLENPSGVFFEKLDHQNMAFENIRIQYEDLVSSKPKLPSTLSLQDQAGQQWRDTYGPYFDLYNATPLPVPFREFRMAAVNPPHRRWFERSTKYSFDIKMYGKVYIIETKLKPSTSSDVAELYIRIIATIAARRSPIKRPGFVRNLQEKWVSLAEEEILSSGLKYESNARTLRHYFSIATNPDLGNTSFIRDMAKDLAIPLSELRALVKFEREYLRRLPSMKTKPDRAFQLGLIQANSLRRRIKARGEDRKTKDYRPYRFLAESVLIHDLPQPWILPPADIEDTRKLEFFSGAMWAFHPYNTGEYYQPGALLGRSDFEMKEKEMPTDGSGVQPMEEAEARFPGEILNVNTSACWGSYERIPSKFHPKGFVARSSPIKAITFASA